MNQPSVADEHQSSRRANSLVVFHFFEANESYIANLAHFLLFGYSTDCDYLIVVAGEHSVDLPQRHNIRYLRTGNLNNDFGGYCAAVELLGDTISSYEFVHFVNSSVRGPFLPAYVNQNWISIFQAKLTGDVALVGSTINILAPESEHSVGYKSQFGGGGPFSHVQTMAYAMRTQTLIFLREAGLYAAREKLEKHEVIRHYELRLSQLILNNGWNITALLPEYNALDYRQAHTDINPVSRNISHGDPNFAGCYFGRSAHPFDVIFVKTNREIFNEALLDRIAFSAWHARRSLPDWSDCAFVTAYIERIQKVATSLDTVDQSKTMSIDDVLNLTAALLQQRPDTHKHVAALVEHFRPK